MFQFLSIKKYFKVFFQKIKYTDLVSDCFHFCIAQTLQSTLSMEKSLFE